MAKKIIEKYNATALYQKFSNNTFNKYVLTCRNKYFDCIERSNIKLAISLLKKGGILCYLPDQGAQVNPVFEDFFNIPCSMTRTIVRLPEITGAKSIFFYYYRDLKNLTYHAHFQAIHEPMTVAMYNRLLEQAVRQHPEQYFWMHRRFKKRPAGDTNNFYH